MSGIQSASICDSSCSFHLTTLTPSPKERQLQKSCFSFETECKILGRAVAYRKCNPFLQIMTRYLEWPVLCYGEEIRERSTHITVNPWLSFLIDLSQVCIPWIPVIIITCRSISNLWPIMKLSFFSVASFCFYDTAVYHSLPSNWERSDVVHWLQERVHKRSYGRC